MTALGKTIRMKRVLDEDSGTSLICALDHGMTSPVFLQPLADIRERVREAVAGGANVLMLSRGMAKIASADLRKTTSVAFMLSASANPGDRPSIAAVAEVEEALRSGADAVVLYVALGDEDETPMIERLAEVGAACEELGVPFIAEAEWPSAYSAVDAVDELGIDYLLRNVRLCAELGADIVKTNWAGDEESFGRLVEAATGLPVVLAGGSRISDEELLNRQEAAMRAGAVGCSVGRNIFMHERPEAITRALHRVIVDRWPASQALEEMAASAPAGNAV
jgi:fructose-bisphosphate aldolase / 2-amino-3,7-dideoxy-D-threo-hept-6-ulosonate synthase